MLIPFLAGILTFILLVKPINERSFRQVINGTSAIRWKRIFVSGFVWMVLSAIYLFAYKGIDPSNFTLSNTGITLLILAVISIVLIPFQAGFEEILFRGYLMQGTAVLFRNRWLPLILTSVIFGVMHVWNPEVKDFGFFTMMPQYVLFGLLFGITTIYDDGIEIALGAHIANNVFLSIMVTNSSSALQTPALFVQKNVQPWLEFAGLLVASVIFFYIMKKIYKWNDLSIINRKLEKPEIPAQIL
jgi:membrane protease YdiL (CAAX protease family)